MQMFYFKAAKRIFVLDQERLLLEPVVCPCKSIGWMRVPSACRTVSMKGAVFAKLLRCSPQKAAGS